MVQIASDHNAIMAAHGENVNVSCCFISALPPANLYSPPFRRALSRQQRTWNLRYGFQTLRTTEHPVCAQSDASSEAGPFAENGSK